MIETCNRRVVACAAAVLFTLVGCSDDTESTGTGSDVTAGDVRSEASDVLGAAGSFAQSTLEQYRERKRDAVIELTQEIEDLKTRGASLTGDARSEADDAIQRLREKRDAFLVQLEEARADSADAWQEVRRGLDRAWTDLDDALKSALERFDD